MGAGAEPARLTVGAALPGSRRKPVPTRRALWLLLLLLQILPRQNERDPSKVEVDVMVREKPTQTADVEAEWGLAAGAQSDVSGGGGLVFWCLGCSGLLSGCHSCQNCTSPACVNHEYCAGHDSPWEEVAALQQSSSCCPAVARSARPAWPA